MPSTNVFVVLNLKQRWMMYCNHYFVLPIIEDIESLRLPLCHCQYLPTDTNTSLPILQKCWTKIFHSTVLSKIDLREGEGESEKMTKYSRSFYPRLLYPFCRMCVETFDSSCNSNGSDQSWFNNFDKFLQVTQNDETDIVLYTRSLNNHRKLNIKPTEFFCSALFCEKGKHAKSR